MFWPVVDESGNPVSDFTGWTARCQVRTHFDIVEDDPETTENESNLLHEFAYTFGDNGVYLEYTEAETAAWDFLRGCADIKFWQTGVPTSRPIKFYLWVSQAATQ